MNKVEVALETARKIVRNPNGYNDESVLVAGVLLAVLATAPPSEDAREIADRIVREYFGSSYTPLAQLLTNKIATALTAAEQRGRISGILEAAAVAENCIVIIDLVTGEVRGDTIADTIRNLIPKEHTMRGLTFSELRAANIARLPTFRNSLGEPAHSKPDGSDWSIAEWAQAVTGEWGELNNVLKKVRRGDFANDVALGDAKIRQELADTIIYLDLLAFRLGIDLSQCIVETFNNVSNRVGSPVYLHRE